MWIILSAALISAVAWRASLKSERILPIEEKVNRDFEE